MPDFMMRRGDEVNITQPCHKAAAALVMAAPLHATIQNKVINFKYEIVVINRLKLAGWCRSVTLHLFHPMKALLT